MFEHILCSLPLVSLMLGSAIAQGTLNDTFDRLKSRDWMVRADAVDQLKSNLEWLRSPAAKQALVELLDHENHGATEPNGGFGVAGTEAHAEYYARVLGLVDSLVDFTDPDAVGILVHSVYNSDSRFAVRLASYGEVVIAPLLALSEHEDPGREIHQRVTAFEMLGQVLRADRLGSNRARLSDRSARAIEARLHEGLRHREAGIRQGAIHAVLTADDVDALPLLDEIARGDRYEISDGRGGKRYILREEAARAIAGIRARSIGR